MSEKARTTYARHLSGVVLPDELRARIVALIEERGENAVRAEMKISRAALERALSGLRVRNGTHALVEIGLRRMAAEKTATTAPEKPETAP